MVKAANRRSVPTARYGLTPKKKMRMGVMSEPPPTPVRPTMSPTANPARMMAMSGMGATLRSRAYIPNDFFFMGVCLR
ncbi:hypothetical protein D9M69_664960 [compost metagenome]